MKMTVQLGQINYGDVAVKAMPLLKSTAQRHDGVIGEIISAISELPASVIHDIFDAISEEKKNGIVAMLSREYHDMILCTINHLSVENRIGVVLVDFAVNQDLTIEAEIAEIDFRCIVERYLPVVRQQLLSQGSVPALFRPVIELASADRIMGMLDRFMGGSKEAFIVSLINRNQQLLISLIEEAAKKQNIRLNIQSVYLEKF